MANIDTAFTTNILSLDDTLLITSGDYDPSGVGYEAPVGSLFLTSIGTGSTYLKVGTGDVDWQKIRIDPVTLDSLSDVTVSGPSNGQTLIFNGTNWVNQTAGTTDQLVKISATDTTAGYLQSKLAAGSNISLTVLNSGANEQIQITATDQYTGTVTSVAATAPAAGFTVSGSPITTSGTLTFTLANDLAAVEGLAGTGLAVRTAADTWNIRNIVAGSSKLTVTNGNGVSGNPSIDLGTVALDDLSDTVITTPTNGQVLKYNGTNWVNSSDAIGTGTVTSVAATAPAAGFTITGSPITTSGTLTFALANDLAAVEGLSGTGITVRTAADTWATRSITGVAGRTVITNGTGVAGDINIDLSTAGTAGTYTSVTTDVYGRVTSGSTTQAWSTITGTPTTLAGYGITDAQPLDADLTSIAGLAGTSGLLRKTAANTWTLDTATYLTGNQTITLSGDGTGSGTTSLPLTLNTVNSNVGTFGTSTSVGTFTVNGKGLITAASNTAISFPVTSVFGRTGAITATEGDYSLTQLSDATITSPTSGQLLSYNGTAWVNINNPLVAADMPILQLRRNVTTSVTTTFTDITWDTQDEENNTGVIEWVSGANITVKEAGPYLITYLIPDNNVLTHTLNVRVRKNATTVLNGSNNTYTDGGAVDFLSNTFVATLAANDTLQLQVSAGVAATYGAGIQISVVRLKGTKGDTGAPGSGSNIIIQDESVNVPNTPHSTINFTGNLVSVGDIGPTGTATINVVIPNDVVLPGTGAVTIPSGTTAQEPAATNAQVRFNTTTSNYEVSIDSQWYPLSVQNVGSTASSSLLFDDMISGDSNTTNGAIQHGSSLNWINNLAGTGAASNNSNFGVNATQKAIGVLTVETGTTATGRSALTLGDSQILFGFCSFSCEWRVAVNALSTAAQEYNLYVGFFDNSVAAGEAVDGIYFKYDRNTSANWILTTSNNSTRTNTTTTVAVTAATYQKLRIDVNSTGTSATFYINGTAVGTITTNIPTGAGRYTGLGWKIEKTAGTTNAISYMDYISVGYVYDTSR